MQYFTNLNLNKTVSYASNRQRILRDCPAYTAFLMSTLRYASEYLYQVWVVVISSRVGFANQLSSGAMK